MSDTFSTTEADWQKQGAEVTVSQNTSTGHTDITIGSETTPVASVEDVEKLLSIYKIPNITNDAYLNVSGYKVDDPVNHSKAILEFLPINGIARYIYSGRTAYSVAAVCFYSEADQSTCIGSYLVSGGETIEAKELKDIIAIPEAAKYVRFSSINELEVKIINDNYLYDEVGQIKEDVKNTEEDLQVLEDIVDKPDTPTTDIPSGEEQHGYYNTSMYFVSGNGYCLKTTAIPCKSGDIFQYKGSGGSSYPSVFMFANNAVAGQVTQSAYYDSPSSYVTIVIPDNIKYVVFQSWSYTSGAEILSVKKLGEKSDSLMERISRIESSNILFGKKLCVCGDSFTAGDFTGYVDKEGHSGYNSDAWDADAIANVWNGNNFVTSVGCWRTYGYHIAKRNQMKYYNQGINGSTLAYHNSTEYTYFSRPVDHSRYTNIPNDADYIVIWFGINDSNKDIPIGTISDDVNTTFYGAWNIVLSYIIEHHPLAKIGIVVTNYADVAYREATIASAKKWGIPYLDIMGDANVPLINGGKDASIELSDTAKNLRNATFCISESNIHPTPYCHEYESTFIENWLRTL